ncbi:MAG: DUF805 domain-containing protein [Lentisphaeria bacterium]|nr:DUF805 domain-containing protein [Lentisphaeria bacterium]
MQTETIPCTLCVAKLIVPVQYSGKQVVCSQCQQVIMLPDFNSVAYRTRNRRLIHKPHLFTAYIRCCDFEGRATRKEYNLYLLLQCFIGIIFLIPMGISAILLPEQLADRIADVLWFLWCMACLIHLIPSLSVTIRRFHDLGSSWLWIWGLLLPIFNIIILLCLIFHDSEQSENQWGAYPKGFF